MKAMKDKYNNDRLSKLMLLGEPVPSSLEPLAKNIEAKKVADSQALSYENKVLESAQENGNFISSGQQASSAIVAKSNEDFSAKDESELVGVLAMSVGKAAIASAKVGVFGIKALLETLSEEEVTKVTGQAVEKSSGIAKVSSGLTESVKKMNAIKSKDDLKNVVNDDLKSGIQATGETFNAFGEAGKVFANKVGSATSASQAADALKETSDDLIQAFNAVTALSLKTLQKKKDNDKK